MKQNKKWPSPRQAQALFLVVRAWRDRTPVPTVRELGAALGISSNNAVADLLAALERKGLLERTPNRARSLRPTSDGVRAALGPIVAKKLMEVA